MEAAAWALIGVAVGAVVTGLFALFQQSRELRHREKMFTLENASKEGAKDILLEMLNHRRQVERSFSALSKPLGGFTEDNVRLLLMELGAKKRLREDGSEWWYLRERAHERVEAGYTDK